MTSSLTNRAAGPSGQARGGQPPGWPPPPPAARSAVSVRGWMFLAWMVALGSIYLVVVLALLIGNMNYIDTQARQAMPEVNRFVAWGAFIRKAIWTPDVRYATKLSLLSSLVTVSLALLIGLPAGYLLSRYRFPGVVLIDTLLDIPIVLPPLVVGVSLLIFFNTGTGRWLNDHLEPVLRAANWLVMGLQHVLRLALKVFRIDYEVLDLGSEGLVFSPWGIVLAQFTVACAFGVRMVKTTFEQVDARIEAVARTLGASRAQAFFRVSLPMARNGILAAAVVTWARAIGEFGPILIFCGTTRQRTEVLPTSIYLEFSVGNLQGALAVSMAMVLLAMGTLLLFKKLGGRF